MAGRSVAVAILVLLFSGTDATSHGGVTMAQFNALVARVASLEAWKAAVESRLTALETGGGVGPAPACSNGVDDDLDKLTDFPADADCTDALDTDEAIAAAPPPQVQEFYVDAARVSPGDGSAANPWKERWEINWTTITGALAKGGVTIYFSSRATWTMAVWTTIPDGTNGRANRRLTLDGQSKFNTVTSGPAVWQNEVDPSRRAEFFTTIGQSGGPVVVRNNSSFITIRGFKFTNAANGPISIGEANPTLNVHDIIAENNVVDTPQNGHGVWFGYAEAGSYNVIVRNNYIRRTPLECIYIGHYNYLPSTITGVIVEGNTCEDTGTNGEGDIDIKPGAFGAIVRYNTMYQTEPGNVLAGIVVGASDVQVYGNELFNLDAFWHPIDGGSGIQINADGADGVGKQLNNILVYNNLVRGNQQRGIGLHANRASIVNAKFLNNTVVGNGSSGFTAAASGGHTIAIAVLVNNVFSTSGAYEVDITSGVSIAVANYNAMWHPAGGTFIRYQDVNRSYAQWQALGFDANGFNADPLLDAAFKPASGSPLIGAAQVRNEFTVDLDNVIRGVAWDIGALER